MFSRLLHDRIRALAAIACSVVLGCGNEPLGIDRRDGASGFGAGPGETRWPADPLRSIGLSVPDLAATATSGGGGTGGAGGSGGDGAGGAPPLQAISIFCGDGVRDPILEECDDGLGSEQDLCTERCQTSDALVARGAGTGTGTSRYLGEGRHPASAGDRGFAVAFVEPGTDTASIGLSVFDAAGDPRSRTIVSTNSTPVSFANPVVAALSDGSYAVAWTAFGDDGDELGVSLRRVTPAPTAGTEPPAVGADLGVTLSSLQHANDSTAFSQYDADLLFVDDTLVVAWTDNSNPETAPDLHYRTFSVNASVGRFAPSSSDQPLADTLDFEGNVALARVGESWAATWRAGGFDGYETIHVADMGRSVHWTVGPHLAGAVEDHPALVELDGSHLLLLYTEGTDPEATGVANVGRLRAAVLDVQDPTSVTSVPIPAADPDYESPAIAQAHPSLVRTGDRLFAAWRSATRPGDSEGENVWFRGLEVVQTASGLELSLDPEQRIPRWPLSSFADQRFPALTAAPPQIGTPGLPGPSPEGALVFAWDDYGQTLGAEHGQPDVLAQYHPLPLVRFPAPRQIDCTVTEPCDPGEGDCDTDAECQPGLVCSTGSGPKHGWAPSVDVCVAPHCNDAVRNADETDVDCGGADCGKCLCGDGVVLPVVGEECDDANEDNTDACPTNCRNATCGDGFPYTGVEACDTAGDSASCDFDCSLPECGDDHINTQAGENCEDGDQDDSDECPTSCETAHCGDGFVWSGQEACDSSGVETAGCNADCTLPVCGDGIVNEAAGETCEPSTNPDCRSDCRALAGCLDETLCIGVKNFSAGSATDNHLGTRFEIVNNSAVSVPLNELRIRYWFTKHDGAESQWPACQTAQASLNTFCDAAPVGCGNITRSTAEVDPWRQGVDASFDVTFTTTQALGPGQSTGQLSFRVERGDLVNLTETNDYSYRAGTSLAYNTKVALYRSGTLIWGSEPMAVLVCGDAVTDACEACDNGMSDTATCDGDCTPAVCGDGHVNAPRGETCDPGPPPTTQTATCDSNCTGASCGDGHVNPVAGEICEQSLIPQCRTNCSGFNSGCTNGTLCLKAQYRATDSASDNAVRPQFRIVNNGFVPIPLSELRLRYYFTIDGTATLQAFCDFASFASNNTGNDCSRVQQVFTTVSPARPGADRYLEVRFTGTTSLAPGQSTGDIQLRFNKTTFANFNETNDYSRTGATSFADTVRVTAFRNGSIIWGTPP